ncbi:hypothetical protein [Antarcticirhabdus aurantiaca]|uniref:hypothetical protein n=1 Tax=Antarcticirhabdus aurantiaca TaxID=2606717 RepID=UPI00131B7108|nr:hypothetical protein [Antarcticirhabdus aurantiaca]
MATKPQASVDRVRASNGNAYNATTNPGGLAQGGHRPNFVPDLNAVADIGEWTADLAEEAAGSAGAAAGSATAAAGSAGAASTSAGAAAGSVQAAADQVALAAAQAQRLAGTSTTSNTSTVASKTFTTQADKAFEVGSFVMIQSRGTLNRWMFGRVTAYSGTSLTVAVEAIGTTTSAGTDWDIRVAGARGAQGDQGPQGTNRIIPEARTSNTALTVVDNAKFLDCTGTFTQTFVAAATLGAGWQATIHSNTGTITLDPNGSEQIDGATTLAVGPGETRQVICTGTAFITVLVDAPVPAAGLVFISQQTVSSAVASVSFVGITNAYDEYLIEFQNVVPTTDVTFFRAQTSSNGGAGYDQAAGDYFNQQTNLEGSVSANRFVAEAFYIATGIGLSNVALYGGVSGRLRLIRPSSTSEYTHMNAELQHVPQNNLGAVSGAILKSVRCVAAKVDAIRFFMSSGTIASGTFKLYGLRKS